MPIRRKTPNFLLHDTWHPHLVYNTVVMTLLILLRRRTQAFAAINTFSNCCTRADDGLTQSFEISTFLLQGLSHQAHVVLIMNLRILWRYPCFCCINSSSRFASDDDQVAESLKENPSFDCKKAFHCGAESADSLQNWSSCCQVGEPADSSKKPVGWAWTQVFAVWNSSSRAARVVQQ